MGSIRVLIAVLALIGLTSAWYTDYLPALIAVPAAVALVIWGLDLDWRRKKMLADVKAQMKERDGRRAEQPKA